MSTKYLRPLIVFLSLVAAFVCAIAVLRFLYIRESIRNMFPEYAGRYDISENLIYAVIKCESGFDPFSVSGAGAIGLMQITPDTLQWAAMKEGEKDILPGVLYEAEKKYQIRMLHLFAVF